MTPEESRELSRLLFEKLSEHDPIASLRSSIVVNEFTIQKMYEDLPPGKTTLLLEYAKRRLEADKRKLAKLEQRRDRQS